MKYEYTISSRDIKREVERLKNAQNEGLILTWYLFKGNTFVVVYNGF